MNHKKFIDIQRIKEGITQNFQKGDLIYIEEKIDGANAAIRYDTENDKIVAQSRKNILNTSNNLRGFYEFAQNLDKNKIKNVLGDNLVLFGEWLCLSGDTVIRKTSAGKNSNYMTLREMYQYKYKNSSYKDSGFKVGVPRLLKYLYEKGDTIRSNIDNDLGYANNSGSETYSKCLKNHWIDIANFNQKHTAQVVSITESGIKKLKQIEFEHSWWGRYGFPSLFSLDFKTDKIISNKMIDIVYTGDKLVYEVTTRKGFKIKSTMEHRFLTPYGFKPLFELKEKDCVAISELKNQRKKDRTYGKDTKRIFAEQKAYKEKIGKCEECGNTTCLELHHIDGNHNNNQISNYKVLCSECHRKIPINGFNGFEYDYEFDYIVSIKEVGIEDCYDIAMSGDESTANFIANGFIVHNCKHTVHYPDERYNNFYAFDIYDIEKEIYLTQNVAKNIADELGLIYVPILYIGEFISWEHCMSFVGKTELGGEYGEGIVIKNQTRLNDSDYRQPFYLKIVGEKFQETKKIGHKKKEISPEVLQTRDENKKLAETIVTRARIQKILNKFVDENIIPEEWDCTSMPIIAKNLTRTVYEDCVKEEPEIVTKIENFGKVANSICMRIAKEIMENK